VLYASEKSGGATTDKVTNGGYSVEFDLNLAHRLAKSMRIWMPYVVPQCLQELTRSLSDLFNSVRSKTVNPKSAAAHT
jgi:hypothetical protein